MYFSFYLPKIYSSHEDVKDKLDVKEEVHMDGKHISNISTEDKVREQNRIRQLAFKARQKMPKDYKTFCLVASHLVKNAHRYYNGDSECNEVKQEVKVDVKEEVMSAKIEVTSNEDSTENCQLANKMLRSIRMLKRKNHIKEQQDLVTKLK